MNPNTDPIYAGIAGVGLDVDSFDLGDGLVLSKTFGHFMAPFLMAFAPAKPGSAHPAPWSAVQGGLGVDFHVQLEVPVGFNIPGFFDRVNTVWWIAALVRLRGAFYASVPVIAERPFAEIPKESSKATILSVEAMPRRAFVAPKIKSLGLKELLWLKKTWRMGGLIMGENQKLNDAFQAFDASGGIPSGSVAMLAIWGALEHLFSPANQELRFRISANIASFLEPPGHARLALHKEILKLYDARSEAAHGTRVRAVEAGKETYDLANRVLLKILEDGKVPSKESLDALLFSPWVS
jgi:hypothetical protein